MSKDGHHCCLCPQDGFSPHAHTEIPKLGLQHGMSSRVLCLTTRRWNTRGSILEDTCQVAATLQQIRTHRFGTKENYKTFTKHSPGPFPITHFMQHSLPIYSIVNSRGSVWHVIFWLGTDLPSPWGRHGGTIRQQAGLDKTRAKKRQSILSNREWALGSLI